MKKILLSFFLLATVFIHASAQIVSIRPDTAFRGQTLTTIITMPFMAFSTASAPYQNTDIYLQQGGTVIYCDPSYSIMNVYGNPPFTFDDSLHCDFSIPANAPNGYYDVHLLTYDYMGIPTDNLLTNGFHVGTFAGTIEGDLYFDINQNGVWDGGEPPLVNHRAQVTPGNLTIYSNAAGHYKAYLDTNNYTVSYLPAFSFSQTSLPVTYAANVPPSYTGLDFGAYSGQSLFNQDFYVWHHPMRCQPANGYTYVDITNNGYLTVQGSVTMVHSSNMSLNNALPAPDVINGDTLTWYYSTLAPGQSLHLGGSINNWISFFDPPAGQTVWYSTVDSVFDMGGNALTQYQDSFGFVVTCSCDPNEKFVSPEGATAQHYTPPNTELTYTINFQNTGNDTAIDVVITDTLDANLDWNTFEVISSTHHPVFAQMNANGVVTFTFPNIMLPDSNVNEPGSHGAVAYHVHTDSLLSDPTAIRNTAYIVFDWNSPVVTNTAISTITSLQYPSASFITGDLQFCPGSCINFGNLSTGATSYDWSFPGANPSSSTDANPANICYNDSGSYDVQLIATNALGSDTLLFQNYVTAFAIAPQGIQQSGDTLIANQGFTSYSWYYNGNVIPGATDYFYLATQSGNYHVISFDANGCNVEAAIFNVLTTVQFAVSDLEITVYPNPVRNNLTIRNGQSAINAVAIFNVLGEKVLDIQSEFKNQKSEMSVDVSGLPSGIYSIEISSSEKLAHALFVKQ